MKKSATRAELRAEIKRLEGVVDKLVKLGNDLNNTPWNDPKRMDVKYAWSCMVWDVKDVDAR